MKAPLEIYQKHPYADAYRVGGFYSPYCLVSENKRFSDAELAAELHRSAMVTGLHGDYIEGFRTETLHRFATLPHFDEEPA